jgi:hypothetical protein
MIRFVVNLFQQLRTEADLVTDLDFKHVSRPAVSAFLRPSILVWDGMKSLYPQSGLGRLEAWVSS